MEDVIDISKFCADRKRGVLYRYQSIKELEDDTKDVISNFELFEKLLQEWKPD